MNDDNNNVVVGNDVEDTLGDLDNLSSNNKNDDTENDKKSLSDYINDGVDSLEDYLDINGEANDISGENMEAAQGLKDGFGKDEFAKTLNDPNYYNRHAVDIEKDINDAKAEMNNDYKEVPKIDNEGKDSDNKKNDEDNPSEENKQKGDEKSSGDNKKEDSDNKKNDEGNPSDDKKNGDPDYDLVKKNQFDRLKDKYNYAAANVNRVSNKIDSVKAKAYEAHHPIEAAKAKVKAKVEKKVKETKKAVKKKIWLLIKTHPFISLLVCVGLLVILLLILLIYGLSGNTSNSSYFNNNIEQIKVEVNDERVFIKDYVIGCAYKYFFVDNFMQGLSKDELKEAFSAYMIAKKTEVISAGFDFDNDDYLVSGSNKDYCDPYGGCKYHFFGGYFTSAETNEETGEPEDADYKGILKIIENNDPEKENAELLLSVSGEVFGKLVVEKEDENKLIIKSDDIKINHKIKAGEILSCVKNGQSYTETLLRLADGVGVDDEYDVSSSNHAIYNIKNFYDTVNSVSYSSSDSKFETANSDFTYVDQGFYWPVGSTLTECYMVDSKKVCDKTVYSTHISSDYTYRTNSNGIEMHTGIDLPTGGATNVAAIAASDGVVVKRGCSTTYWHCGYAKKGNDPYYGGGCQITVDHGNGITTRYLHLQNLDYVSIGEEVKRGQIIGLIGTTGCSTGEHLHFEVNIYGTPVNPRNYVSQSNTRPA